MAGNLTSLGENYIISLDIPEVWRGLLYMVGNFELAGIFTFSLMALYTLSSIICLLNSSNHHLENVLSSRFYQLKGLL